MKLRKSMQPNTIIHVCMSKIYSKNAVYGNIHIGKYNYVYNISFPEQNQNIFHKIAFLKYVIHYGLKK